MPGLLAHSINWLTLRNEVTHIITQDSEVLRNTWMRSESCVVNLVFKNREATQIGNMA